MKIVLAPDSFKGSLTALEVCAAMERGIRQVVPEAMVTKIPMADGGEGTAANMAAATGGSLMERIVEGPLGDPVAAGFGVLGDGQTAVIEMAAAAGLCLLTPERRNPLLTSTYGVGQLILAALELQCRSIILAIGGSATNDAGFGMARALGYKLMDAGGRELSGGGGTLDRVAAIDTRTVDPRLKNCTFLVACDVDNPLCGPQGASAVFGPQKGATPQMVATLDRNLRHFAEVIEKDLGVQVLDMPGAGAAGGLGAGAAAFLKAGLVPGVELAAQTLGLEEALRGADLVLTGEGRCDSQTLRGKVPFGVARYAKKAGIPVVVLAGSLGEGAEALHEQGIAALFSIQDRPMSLEESLAETPLLLAAKAREVMRLWLTAKDA